MGERNKCCKGTLLELVDLDGALFMQVHFLYFSTYLGIIYCRLAAGWWLLTAAMKNSGALPAEADGATFYYGILVVIVFDKLK